jgi:hypothetical protein
VVSNWRSNSADIAKNFAKGTPLECLFRLGCADCIGPGVGA